MREQQIEALIKPAVEALGYELWGVQIIQAKQILLRIFIDAEQGIGIDDCEKVSRQVSRILDVEEPINTEYTLEVSSPGMDRPLFTLEQYARFSGSQVNIRLRVPYKGRRNYKGILAGVENGDVLLRFTEAGKEEEEMLLPIEGIDKAHIMPVFE